jgi:hypothetical protein
MDIEQLQAARAQLVYEFGEIEYERRLHVQRVQYLEQQYNQKLAELQEVEAELDRFNQSMQKITDSGIFSEKNDENILKSE